MILRVANWSVHDISFLNPAWSSLNRLSTSTFNLSRIILFSTFPAVDSNRMPLQFWHSFRSPFFGSLFSYTPSFQLSGISFVSQIFPNSWCSVLVEVFRSAFMASGTSVTAAFPFLRCLMALVISASLDLFSLTCKCVTAGCMSGILLKRRSV